MQSSEDRNDLLCIIIADNILEYEDIERQVPQASVHSTVIVLLNLIW